MKTHAGWRLERTGPRLFRWTSPLGRLYTVHTGETRDHSHVQAIPDAPPGRHRH